MRRIHIHLFFGTIAAFCSALLVGSLVERNAAITANQVLVQQVEDAQVGEGHLAALVHGVRIAVEGNEKAAQQAYQRVIQDGPPTLQQVARFNLGNLHLRQGMELGAGNPQAVPLIELAKQQYREVLAADPDNWNARYNLERALWLSPELESAGTAQQPGGPRQGVVTAAKIEAGALP